MFSRPAVKTKEHISDDASLLRVQYHLMGVTIAQDVIIAHWALSRYYCLGSINNNALGVIIAQNSTPRR